MFKYITFGFVLLMCSTSCNKESAQCDQRNQRAISFGFESSIEDWIALGGNIEAIDSSAIVLSSEVAKSGSKSARFSVGPDSYVNGGVRAELTFDQMISEGDETHYEYSLFIPVDYQDVESIRAEDGKPNWQIMGQWHDQPDECLGETWDDIASHSPPIALYYNYLSREDPAYLSLLSDSIYNNIYGVDTAWNGVSTIALEYGGRAVAIREITKGEWIDFKFHIKWSQSNEGFIEAWFDGEAFTNGRVIGGNMLNNASHYFKFGLYRNPDISHFNNIYCDDLEIY